MNVLTDAFGMRAVPLTVDAGKCIWFPEQRISSPAAKLDQSTSQTNHHCAMFERSKQWTVPCCSNAVHMETLLLNVRAYSYRNLTEPIMVELNMFYLLKFSNL
jgi:hypothetical protein